MLLNTVTGPNTKLKAYFILLKVICCGVEPSQNLELIVCPGDPISENRTSNSVFYKWDVKVFSVKPEKRLGRHKRKSLLTKEKEVFLRRTLSRGSQNGIGVFSDRGRRTTNWLGALKVPSNYGCCWKGMPYLPNSKAKIDSTITKYIGHNFTKVTTFIIIIIKK